MCERLASGYVYVRERERERERVMRVLCECEVCDAVRDGTPRRERPTKRYVSGAILFKQIMGYRMGMLPTTIPSALLARARWSQHERYYR